MDRTWPRTWNRLDPNEAYKPDAPILLYYQDCDSQWQLIGQTVTDGNGYYIFENLAPGNYRVEEDDVSSLGYQSSGTQIRSDVYAASQLNSSTIQIQLVEPLTARFYNYSATQLVNVNRYGVALNNLRAGQLRFQLSNDGGSTYGPLFYTFCIDLYHGLVSAGDTFAVVPETGPRYPGLEQNIGRIGFLLNQYGTAYLSSTYAAALNLALWELVYDVTPDLSAGNFRASAGSTTMSWANYYLNLSAGKYEAVMFLNVDDPDVQPGDPMQASRSQGVLAQNSFNFANVPLAEGEMAVVGYEITTSTVIDRSTGSATGAALYPAGSLEAQQAHAIGWTIRMLPEDVNGDGLVTALDALLVINDLNQNGARDLTGFGTGTIFPDVDAAGTVTPRDVLLVINYLNSRNSFSGGEGESPEDLYDRTFENSETLPASDLFSSIPGVRYIDLSGEREAAAAITDQVLGDSYDQDAALTLNDSKGFSQLERREDTTGELEDWEDLDEELALAVLAEDISRAWGS